MRISDWNSDVCSSDLRDAVPTVQVAVSFDAGYAADPHGALGTQSLMLSLMDEGTTRLDSIAFAEAKERLGAQIDGPANADETHLRRSEERRVGNECVRKGRSRWSRYN